ncbi:nitrilase-related carbon-nitrogen hydrolase [Maricaulis sp.]|uniref:nitrilase-related carbon-nitrogen hydrolase n=1 Tax=Maricaulis sp. TaxID=1486257 RepID=UPI003A8DD2EE
MRIIAIMLVATITLILMWGVWRQPASLTPAPDLVLRAVERVATGEGPWLVGVQPWLDQTHYHSASALHHRLAAYLAEIADEIDANEGSVIVFPEHVGTWLVAAGAPRSAFTAETIAAAMTALVAANPLRFAAAWLGSSEDDRMAAAIFRMRADAMARDYQAVFSALAAEYRVTIAAGSIVLPEPRVENGVLLAGEGPLYNTAAVFHPDGSIDPQLVRKSHPIPGETPFTASWPAQNLPVFDTPSGRMAVLICADSWHPDLYDSVRALDAAIIAVPAFLQPSNVWDAPWGGYTTGWPDDADRNDAGRLTEGEAWQRYALAGRLRSGAAGFGMTAYLRGQLWDLGSDGTNIAIAGETVFVSDGLDGAALTLLPLHTAGD